MVDPKSGSLRRPVLLAGRPAGIIRSLAIVMLLTPGPAQADVDFPVGTKSSPHPVTARDLVELRDMRGLSVSPDGRHVAFQMQEASLAANRYELGWYVASALHPGPATNVGNGGEPIPRIFDSGIVNGDSETHPPIWSPDGLWIAYLVRHGADVQLWRSAVDGIVQERVTRSEGRVVQFAWSDDASNLFFTVDDSWAKAERALREEGERGYLVDERFIPFYSSRPIWPQDAFGSPTLPVRVMDFQTGKERPATEAEAQAFQARIAAPKVDGHPDARVIARPDDERILAWAEPEPDQRDGRYPPLTVHATGIAGVETSLRCPESACTGLIQDIWLSPGATELYFLRREGVDNGSLGLYAWSLETDEVRAILRTNDYLADCDLGRAGLVCFHEAALIPRRLVSIDLTTGTLKTLVDANARFLSLRKGKVKRLTWNSTEYDQEAFGHVVLPPDYEEGRRYPLVITTYSSLGFLRGGVGDEYPILPLAENGFVVLNFDQPSDWSFLAAATSSREVDEAMRKEDDGLDRIRSSLDAAIDLLIDMQLIDPRRIAITGLSLGSEIVLYCLTRPDNPFAAAAMSSPSGDPIYYYLGGAGIQQRLESLEYGFPKGEDAQRWEDRSPSTNVEHIRAPLLVQAAESEYLLALELGAAMREVQRPFELYVFPDEKHIKSQPKHRYYTYLRNVQWLKFWLQGIEEPGPVDSLQYERWRAMRSTMPP